MAGELSVEERVEGPDVGAPGAAGSVGGFRSWLAMVDVEELSDAQRLDLVGELERVKGAAAAVQARATDALRVSTEASAARDAARSVGSQVALARRESPALGDRFVGLARALVHEMPRTLAALTGGVIGERHAVAAVQATAALSREHRGVVDARLGPVLGRLGFAQLGRAAGRVAAELDAASVVARMEAAVRSRRVTVRPAPDGMAYLSVMGPLKDVVGAHAALLVRSRSVVGGQAPDEAPQGRGVGAVAADTALRLLSGRCRGEMQPVEVHLVMTDRSLMGTGDTDRSVFEPARIPGHGSVPAPVARSWLREATVGSARPEGFVDVRSTGAGQASVWLRRLYTSPSGRDLVAMDSRRRVFSGLLRRMLVLRDDVCVTPWCGAPVAHADHATPVRQGGVTSWGNGDGRCARCNHVKEASGWSVSVTDPGPQLPALDDPGKPSRPAGGSSRAARPWTGTPRGHERSADARSADARSVRLRRVTVRTPTGHVYSSSPPPLLGWGSDDPAVGEPAVRVTNLGSSGVRFVLGSGWSGTAEPRRQGAHGAARGSSAANATRWATHTDGSAVGSRKRPVRRPRIRFALLAGGRRPPLASRLERQLCRYLR